MGSLMETIKHRTSVRTFRTDALWKTDEDKIMECAAAAANPYGLPIEWRILHAKEQGLNAPVISGADTYLAGKMKKEPHAEEAFGFSFEEIVLFAEEIGLGTTIIAGTMNRSEFEKAMEMADDEVMPCTTPLGYPAAKRGLKEIAMRKAIGADKRIKVEEFLFDKSFDTPADVSALGELADVFEMVRWAPSAVNKQPWRLVLDDHKLHFYKKGNKGFVDADTGWDIQKIDIGIAMLHFEKGAEEIGLQPVMELEDPGIPHDPELEYISSYIF